MAKRKNQPGNRNSPKEQQDNKQDYTPAHDQAEKDIEKDPDLRTRPNREDDLDEGELARLEGED